MSPILLHLYGPFAIHAYGFFMALGLLVALFLAHRDPRTHAIITNDQGMSLLSGGIITGLLGGRILHLIIDPSQFTSWYDLFAFWQGGFAELGVIIAGTLWVICYLRHSNVPLLPFMDLAALYVPIIQGFGRIGCFFAGCCYGAPTAADWGVTYTHPLSLAPLYVKLHPTQLYAATLCFALFFVLKKLAFPLTKPGQLCSVYFIGAGLIRFIVDFWRDDRTFIQNPYTLINTLSSYQWIALGIIASGAIGLIITTTLRHTKKV